jgi:hypothetical protein
MNDLTTITSSKDLLLLLDNMIDCYRDTKINTEIESTKREQIRCQARVAIKKLELDSNQILAEIQKDSDLNIQLIQQLGVLFQRDTLDETCVMLCEKILSMLR